MKKILVTLFLVTFGLSQNVVFSQMENQRFERILPVLSIYIVSGILIILFVNWIYRKKNSPKDFSIKDRDAPFRFWEIAESDKENGYEYKLTGGRIMKGLLSTPPGEPLTMNDGEPYWFTDEPFLVCLAVRDGTTEVYLLVQQKNGKHCFVNKRRDLPFNETEYPSEFQNIRWSTLEKQFTEPKEESTTTGSAFGTLPNIG